MLDPTQSATPARMRRRGTQSHQLAAAEQCSDDTPSLFDAVVPGAPSASDREQLTLGAALCARDDGQRTALFATDIRWRQAAERAIEDLARSGLEWSIEDVTDRVGRALGSPRNALGGLISTAARRGLIVKVGYRQSREPSRAGGVVAVWRGA